MTREEYKKLEDEEQIEYIREYVQKRKLKKNKRKEKLNKIKEFLGGQKL